MPYLLLKFDKKHDGDVGEPVWPNILDLPPNFVQKWDLEQPKMEGVLTYIL